MHVFHLVQKWKFQLSLPDDACKRISKCSFLLREVRVQLRNQEAHIIGEDDEPCVGRRGCRFPSLIYR